MPPSFPFGGMENPCITFVTPCLLAGDRSLVDVIIHEISHSWFGNLVTNATWGEFWLNEGFTMYAQRRISTEVYGAWLHAGLCGPHSQPASSQGADGAATSASGTHGPAQQRSLLCSFALPALGSACSHQPIAVPLTLHPHSIIQLWGKMPCPPHVVLSSPHMWVRGSKHSSSTPGSAYTCLEAATGRALLRQHMDTTGEEHPLNKLRVVIEPGLGGWAAGIRAALWWGAAWHRGGGDESEHSARFAEQGMISFVLFPFCPARCQPGRHVQ